MLGLKKSYTNKNINMNELDVARMANTVSYDVLARVVGGLYDLVRVAATIDLLFGGDSSVNKQK